MKLTEVMVALAKVKLCGDQRLYLNLALGRIPRKHESELKAETQESLRHSTTGDWLGRIPSQRRGRFGGCMGGVSLATVSEI